MRLTAGRPGSRQLKDFLWRRHRDRLMNQLSGSLDCAQGEALIRMFTSVDRPIARIGKLVDDPVP